MKVRNTVLKQSPHNPTISEQCCLCLPLCRPGPEQVQVPGTGGHWRAARRRGQVSCHTYLAV